MELNPEACYRAVLARDERHDGRFFTCVKTTRIYCRPVCPARPPKRENCQFVPSAAAAQEAGFRPCLRCRPEKAPELWTTGGTKAVARALRWIDDGVLDTENVAALAERLQISERQLRRLFQQELGASPIAVAQTRRILLALQLLQQTDLSMIDVALASGFQSVRRFNEAFQAMYDRPPRELRRLHPESTAPSTQLSLLLPYRKPYDWLSMLEFFGQRAIAGVEHVANGVYARTIELDGASGTLQVTDLPEESALRATISFPRLKSLPQIIARVRRMFDLSADIGAISQVLAQDPTLAPLVAARPGLRIPGAWDGFEIAVRAILGQQITVRAARTMASRLVSQYGARFEADSLPELTHRFPTSDALRQIDIEKLGMPKGRATAILHLAEQAANNPRLFETIGERTDAIDQLCEFPGIGPWTAQYIAMRVLRESDAFLAADVGLQRAMAKNGVRPTAKQLLAHAETWRPWRSYAVMHLWTGESATTQSPSGKEVPHAIAS
ncbi:helix-turn-helix domain-containing protein [Blastopirellula sp. JC732]|uniref:DNA-3-methyladenine glycosylase II n=1 Tax=Blastopirellula sediminis TaxID=2894196 RepID=A0A9X1MHP1_9BACT|nr:DNA-3-methyladenine glycosylase 2 [Blastopirellula sediminis]MCC9607904.1 helix-turn-helix domain-containing protein [Blastopirellula sediminis]MCC9627303.1 helix-turn-helix domain-containing protein [Blastopirellula sediminis]